MPIEFPSQNGVRFIKSVIIPMSDGVKLAMDMHVPDCEDWQHTPRPLILSYDPYRKDDAAPYSGSSFAQHGFISARLDCRGVGSSEGSNTDEYTPQEQQDCVDVIEWIAQQPWCTGKIGMIGLSYSGYACVQVAAHRPPHLTTIVPQYFTDDRYTDDSHYRGGCFRGYFDIGMYATSMVGRNALPTYPEYSGDDWARIWEEHLQNNEPYLFKLLEHQTDGEYWRPGSIRGRYDQIQCSALLVSGWRDAYPTSSLRTFEHLKAPKKVLAGPWNHGAPGSAVPGPLIDFQREVLRWFDYWLKGEQNGVMDGPPVAVYVQSYDEPRADRLMTSGYWRGEQTFPIPGSGELAFYLSGNGSLSASAPSGSEASDAYEYRPTVGTCGGLVYSWPFGLPTDQCPDEIHSLNYTTAPLDAPLEIIGMPRAVLHVSSTAPVMAFVARLCDVAPDGTSALVCIGALNGTRRESLTDPKPMEPGEVYELAIELDCTAWRFEPGHRIRLSICSADFPNLWPTPYPGTNRVYRSSDRPSRMILPVVPLKEKVDEVKFEPSKSTPDVYRLSPDDPVWQIVHDVLGDRTGLKTHFRTTGRTSATMELTEDRQFEFWASNRNPADVIALGKNRRRIVRSDGVITVDAGCNVKSTETAFHVTIDLDIIVNGMPHHQRRWVRSFPRVLWSARANIDAADVVQQVHQDYLRVGADIITSNNFWTSPTRLAPIGLGDKWEDYARAAAENAVKARNVMNSKAYVAGGMAPPSLQSRPASRAAGRNDPDVVTIGKESFHKEFAGHAKLLADVGVDVLLAEYVGHIVDCVAAVDACAETGLPVFLGVRHVREDGSMQYGEKLEDLVAALKGHKIDAILLMCSAPENISAGIPYLKNAFDGPVGAYPNIGYNAMAPLNLRKSAEPKGMPSQETDFLKTGDYFPARLAAFAQEWKDMGAQIIGGCCATGPEHIQAMCPVVKG